MEKNNYISEDLFSALTKSEYAVAQLLLKGFTRQQIAEERCISLSCANFHIKNIYAKTGCKTINEFLLLHVKLNAGDK